MLGGPFPPWPSYSDAEADAVKRVLRSNRVNYWTGEEARAFEREFAESCGTEFAVALANGTVALEAALRAVGVGPGDEVIVTPRSFVASATSVLSVGAKPVFADVDRDTQNISTQTCAKVLSPRTRAIIAVHLAGQPCDMDPLMEFARAHEIVVIEDCAQAHGARYKGRSVGSIGAIGAWSFCQDKILTTGGEGGMVTTNGRELWSRMWSHKDHGKSYDAVYSSEHPPGYRWVHESLGTNWRLTEMQAAIGRIQLRILPEWVAKRRAYADRIWKAARDIPGLRAPAVPAWAEHAAYKCYVFVEPSALSAGWSRDRIVAEISARGVPCFQGTCPEIYLEKAFDGVLPRPTPRLPVAQELGETSLMFLVHPTLEERHISLTCEVLREVMRQAVR